MGTFSLAQYITHNWYNIWEIINIEWKTPVKMPQIYISGLYIWKASITNPFCLYFTKINDCQSHRQRSLIFDILPYNSLNIALIKVGKHSPEPIWCYGNDIYHLEHLREIEWGFLINFSFGTIVLSLWHFWSSSHLILAIIIDTFG